MSQLSEIYDGWKNYVFQDPQVEELAKKRIAICVINECKKFKANKSCAMCGCFMPAKCRSKNSKCPLKKW
jgi:hypothetical protein